jgi:glycosyltransferase involved in cell wall biosynthesis
MPDGTTERPLQIAVIASSRHPIAEPFAGGLEAHVWHLTRALTAAGHEVTLFAGPGSDVGPGVHVMHVNIFEPSEVARGDVSMPSETAMRDHHAYLTLMLELAADPGRFDVIHNHSLHYLPIAMAPALSTPMVTTLHTPPTPWLESAMTAAPHPRCVAVSGHTARLWEHVLGPTPVVRNGVRIEHWPEGTGGTDLVWFGRLVPEKGAHLAIEAARLAGKPLRLAGPRSDEHYFTTMIEPALDDQIRYVGHLGHSALAELVGSSAATLVTPMWDEPYGLVVAESLACGTPVASFDRGGIPEIVGTDGGILVPPGDVAALASAALAAARYDRCSVRQRALTHCSEDAMMEQYHVLYSEMAGRENIPA